MAGRSTETGDWTCANGHRCAPEEGVCMLCGDGLLLTDAEWKEWSAAIDVHPETGETLHGWRDSPNTEGLWVMFDPSKPAGVPHYEVVDLHHTETWDEREDGDVCWYLPIPLAPRTEK